MIIVLRRLTIKKYGQCSKLLIEMPKNAKFSYSSLILSDKRNLAYYRALGSSCSSTSQPIHKLMATCLEELCVLADV